MSGHTPGPWYAIGARVFANADGEPLSIADFDMDTRIDHDTAACANATLGAAGPEMLEALKEALEFFEDRADAEYLPGKATPVGNIEMKLAGELRAAIAKAEGRS